MTSEATTTHPLDGHVRTTLTVALVVFVWTIGIGILNGLDLVEFERPVLLSHLHGGTLGWMTLGIMGATMWLFGEADDGTEVPTGPIRLATTALCVAIPLYVVAFALTSGVARPIAGSVTLLGLATAAFWAYGRARHVTVTVPHLLVLLGLTASMIGGGFGVFNGLAIANGWTWVPEGFYGAHPGTMEIGFVIPVAMGLSEWLLRRGEEPERPTRSGWIQAGLMGVAFLWVLTFLLLEQQELVGPGTAFGIVATVILFVRLRTQLRATSLTARAPGRHAVAGAVFIGVTFIYIFVILGAAKGDFNAIPQGRVLSFIHLLAIGATTNALLGFVTYLSRQRTPAAVVDDVVFWGVNVGLIGFVVALTTEVRGLIAVFVPVMGLSLLLAIAVHVAALQAGRRSAVG